MRYGISLGYDWQMDTIRFTPKVPRLKRGNWLRCGAYAHRNGQSSGEGTRKRPLQISRRIVYRAENTSGQSTCCGKLEVVSERLDTLASPTCRCATDIEWQRKGHKLVPVATLSRPSYSIEIRFRVY